MTEAQSPLGGAFSISDAIEKLKANPEIISMVASALKGSGASAETSSSDGEESTSKETAVIPDVAPNLGELMASLSPILSGMRSNSQSKHTEHKSTKDRDALLCALKPYVNESRQLAIDNIIKISQVTDALRHLS